MLFHSMECEWKGEKKCEIARRLFSTRCACINAMHDYYRRNKRYVIYDTLIDIRESDIFEDEILGECRKSRPGRKIRE